MSALDCNTTCTWSFLQCAAAYLEVRLLQESAQFVDEDAARVLRQLLKRLRRQHARAALRRRRRLQLATERQVDDLVVDVERLHEARVVEERLQRLQLLDVVGARQARLNARQRARDLIGV